MNAAINDNFCAHCTPFLAPASVDQLGTRPPDMIMRNDVSETNLQAPCTQDIYLGLTVLIDPCLDPLVGMHGTVRLTLATLSEKNSATEESISPREERHLYVVRNYCSVQSIPSLSLQDESHSAPSLACWTKLHFDKWWFLRRRCFHFHMFTFLSFFFFGLGLSDMRKFFCIL